MKRLTTFVLLLAALALAACSSADASPTAPAYPAQGSEELTSPEATAYPMTGTTKEGYPVPGLLDTTTTTSGAYPAPYTAETTTGVAAVDRVLAALPSSDPAALQNLFVYASAACSTSAGSAPQCNEGEAEGTQVEGLPVVGGESPWLRKGQLPADFLAGPLNLLGVYQVDPASDSDPNYPAGQYAIVATQASQPDTLILLRVDEAGILRVDYKMDGMESNFSDVGQFLLPLQP